VKSFKANLLIAKTTNTHILFVTGRSILGHQAANLLTEQVLQIANHSLIFASLDADNLRRHILSIEDQDELRRKLRDAGLIAFIPNGAILPRVSGDSDLPMAGPGVVPFKSPSSLERTFSLPNRGPVLGMGV
jgi:predicted ABC-class ATPase